MVEEQNSLLPSSDTLFIVVLRPLFLFLLIIVHAYTVVLLFIITIVVVVVSSTDIVVPAPVVAVVVVAAPAPVGACVWCQWVVIHTIIPSSTTTRSLVLVQVRYTSATIPIIGIFIHMTINRKDRTCLVLSYRHFRFNPGKTNHTKQFCCLGLVVVVDDGDKVDRSCCIPVCCRPFPRSRWEDRTNQRRVNGRFSPFLESFAATFADTQTHRHERKGGSREEVLVIKFGTDSKTWLLLDKRMGRTQNTDRAERKTAPRTRRREKSTTSTRAPRQNWPNHTQPLDTNQTHWQHKTDGQQQTGQEPPREKKKVKVEKKKAGPLSSTNAHNDNRIKKTASITVTLHSST